MMSTDETDSHAGAQLSQKAYLLVSLLEQQVQKSDIPTELYHRLSAQIGELNTVLGDLRQHIKQLSPKPADTEVTTPPPLLQLHEHNFTLCSPQQAVKLTRLEFRLHATLAKRPKHIFSRSQLIDNAYADLTDISERTIDCHIRKLRSKHRQLYPDLRFIHTLYGVGYYYAEPELPTLQK
ncbi:winged helix-turn-helix domain-containing protein [Rheinheimera aquimaris]|jgi:DNA-binding response OmpR family regulator|uniref:winged helix-turn-helix domain-containing protein n=1 Tax=Rheinheimera aquimaris TaxID=412437 RepID=UPI000E9E3E21|nr:winged helix-turn-helix domain-containing protein [Rheinheimera aquimaris]HBN90468.1 hypothetical protein [Rheinheimera sp.]|tara:strand:- start:3330 stop:3869 length:540 start_codon:yes stop_codon:yes gene_type:complete